MEEETRLISTSELMKHLGLTHPTIDRGIRNGLIPFYRIGGKGKYLFKIEEVEDALKNTPSQLSKCNQNLP